MREILCRVCSLGCLGRDEGSRGVLLRDSGAWHIAAHELLRLIVHLRRIEGLELWVEPAQQAAYVGVLHIRYGAGDEARVSLREVPRVYEL